MLDLVRSGYFEDALDLLCKHARSAGWFSIFVLETGRFAMACMPGHDLYEPWMDKYRDGRLVQYGCPCSDIARDLLTSETFGLLTLGMAMWSMCGKTCSDAQLPIFACGVPLAERRRSAEEAGGFEALAARLRERSGLPEAVIADHAKALVRSFSNGKELETFASINTRASKEERRVMVDVAQRFFLELGPPVTLSAAWVPLLRNGGAHHVKSVTPEQDRRVPGRLMFLRSSFLRLFRAAKALAGRQGPGGGSSCVALLSSDGLSGEYVVRYEEAMDVVHVSERVGRGGGEREECRMRVHPNGCVQCFWDQESLEELSELEALMERLQQQRGAAPLLAAGPEEADAWTGALAAAPLDPQLPSMSEDAVLRAIECAPTDPWPAPQVARGPFPGAERVTVACVLQGACHGMLANPERALEDFGRVLASKGTWMPVHPGDTDDDRMADLMIACTLHPVVETAFETYVDSVRAWIECTAPVVDDGGCMRTWMERLSAEFLRVGGRQKKRRRTADCEC